MKHKSCALAKLSIFYYHQINYIKIHYFSNKKYIQHKLIQIKNIRFLTKENGQLKGFGYVEFEARADLVEALKRNGQNMLNRAVKIDVADSKGLLLLLTKLVVFTIFL